MKRNFSHSFSILLLLLMIGCMPLYSLASTHAAAPKSIRIRPDLAGHWFLDGKLEFGCEVAYTNGGKRRTAGYLNGNVLWSEFFCTSEQATFDNGVCYVDLAAVMRNQQTLVIEVQCIEYPLIKASFTLKVPPLTSIGVALPKRSKLRYGSTLEPLVTVAYANGVEYVFEPSGADALIASDSLELYFNQTRILDGRIELPPFSFGADHAFTISVVWKSKPWINDLQQFSYDGNDDCTVKFSASSGRIGANQTPAPAGMIGAEGFYGGSGVDGLPVELRVYLNADQTVLHVDATCAGKSVQRKLNPQEASYTLTARGGEGGLGGVGGNGGNAPFSDPYSAGIGGKGGRGGRGGKGSPVKVICASGAQHFLPCIIIDNSGGDGGAGGKGGRGGAYANTSSSPTLMQLLFPSHNYSGEKGEEGEQGESGGEAVIEIVD